MFCNLKLLKDNTGKIFLLIFYLFALKDPLVAQCINSTNIYYNNFDSTVGQEWSTGNSMHLVSRDSLGPFSAETVTFKSDSINVLPCHDSVKVSFKLILKGSWDGNGDHCCGPDIFIIKANGIIVYTTTFSNTSMNHQSYPAQYYPPPNTINNSPYTGSANNNQANWSAYFFSFTFPHTAGDIIIDIAQPASQGLNDEVWYIDDFYLDVCRSSTTPYLYVTPPATAICSGDSVTLIAGGATTYSWSPSYGLSSGSGSVVKASPAVTTTYTVTGNTKSCALVTYATVSVKQKSLVAIEKSICQGQSYLGYNSTGIYNDTLAAANGCDSIRTLHLTVMPEPHTTINKSICQGQSYMGHTTTGTFTDTLAAFEGCSNLRIINLVVEAKPAPKLGGDKDICTGDSLQLSPGSFASYLWQDNSTSDHLIVKRPGIYSIIVTNACGSGRDEIVITEKLCNASFPNAFTPNKDGKNDLFKILNAYNLREYNLVIYNCWGQKIFYTKDYTQGWNGTFKGEPQDSGIYIYYCTFKSSGNAIVTKGTVTLIR